jgi:hypothetical protein
MNKIHLNLYLSYMCGLVRVLLRLATNVSQSYSDGYVTGTGFSAGHEIPTRTRTRMVPVPVTRAGYPYPCRSLLLC